MIPTLRRLTPLLCLLGCLFLAAVPATAAVPPAEKLLPPDTFFLVTVPDFDALRAVSGVSPQLRFWNDPAMKPFHDKFMSKLQDACLGPAEKNLGLNVADFASLPHGQLTLALTINGSNGHDDIPPGGVLLLDARDQAAALATNLDALKKKWSAAGRDVRTEQIRGVDFSVVTLSTNDLAALLPHATPVAVLGATPKPARTVDVYFTQYHSLLIAGNSPGALQTVIASLTGGSLPVLADDPVFAADQLAQFRDAPTYYAWFNARVLVSQMAHATDDNPDAPASLYSPVKILGALGLNGLQSAALALREARDGSLLTLYLNSPAADRQGLLGLLALPSKDASPPGFVPDDAVKFSRLRLDGRQTWSALQKIIAAFSPNGLAYLNSIIDLANTAGSQKEPGFDLRNDLFANLSDDIISWQESPRGDSPAALAQPPELTLVAVNQPDQVIASINVIATMVASQENAPPPRDFLGHKIYAIAGRPQHLPDGSVAAGNPLLVSSSGGYVALSTDPAILEEFLRNTGGTARPLSRLPGLAEAQARIGGTRTGLFGCQNQQATMRTAFQLLKTANPSASPLRLLTGPWHDWMDFSLLPDFDLVAKYFYLSVYNETTTPDGITIKAFSPRPPRLN